jgi:lysozyme
VNRALLSLVLLVPLAAVLYARRARAAIALAPELDAPPMSSGWSWPALPEFGLDAWPLSAPGGDSVSADANLAAFLAMLRHAEGTAGPEGYRMLFGGSLFASYADHPANLGWRGTPLPDHLCRAAGFGPGCVSTAAGAYQILRPTWRRIRGRLDLPDFSPPSQDSAAIELIRERGALDDVRAGRVDAAIARVRSVWASLPGAGYGQPERGLADLRQVYASSGGSYG